jgi:hypothetical protein
MITSTRSQRVVRGLGVAGSLGCFLLVASASAAPDEKSYHGASCQPKRLWSFFTSEWAEDYSDNVEYSIDHVGARDGTAVVICPLVRDRTGSTSQVDSVHVEAFSLSGGEFSCTIFSQGEDTDGYYIDFDSDDFSSTGLFSLTMGGSDLTTTAGNEGTYALECTMPTNSDLFHIYVREENTDE